VRRRRYTPPRSRRALREWVWPRTLRFRLVASVAALVALSFAITFLAVYRGTGTAVRAQIEREIGADASAFERMLQGAHSTSARALRAVAGAYVNDQPFRASSTLLFAIVGRSAPTTNQPELLNTASSVDRGESKSAQLREDAAARRLLAERSGFATIAVADIGELRLVRERFAVPLSAPVRGDDVDSDRPPLRPVIVTIGVGESLAPVASAQAGVARAFILAGVIVLVASLLAAYLLGSRFSLPLRRMARVAMRVDAGDLAPRIAPAANPAQEVRVLGDAFNHMLDRLTDAFSRQRTFVADASHELRTPLTVLQGQLELLLSQGEPSARELARVGALMEAEIGRIRRLIDDLLALAKSERRELLRRQELDLERFVLDIWEGITATAHRRFELASVPAGILEADPDRLAQALRNLISNAIEHTAEGEGLVRLSVAAADGRVCFTVDDDGPGIPESERERIFDRFHRTDSARGRRAGGAGLGLAIVRAIARAHGGGVRAAASPAGGARIVLELPCFSAQREAPDRQRLSEVA